MTRVYVDTSALAKWYINEALSEAVEAYIEAHAPLAISTLTVAEMRSLLARRRRAGDIDATTEGRAFATFEGDVQRGHLTRRRVEDGHVLGASTLIAEYPAHPLRTLDALHLAVVLDLGLDTVATADGVMADAAEAMGLSVVRFMARA